MARYAEIIDKEVVRVLVIDDSWTEEQAQEFLANVSSNLWVKTESKAGNGFEYDPEEGSIRRKKPFDSWVYDQERSFWVPPIPRPIAIPVGYMLVWAEDLKTFVLRKFDRDE